MASERTGQPISLFLFLVLVLVLFRWSFYLTMTSGDSDNGRAQAPFVTKRGTKTSPVCNTVRGPDSQPLQREAARACQCDHLFGRPRSTRSPPLCPPQRPRPKISAGLPGGPRRPAADRHRQTARQRAREGSERRGSPISSGRQLHAS